MQNSVPPVRSKQYNQDSIMRDSLSPDHTVYADVPHYPPIRRSGRQLYNMPETTHAEQYHTSATSLPSNYGMDLSYSGHHISPSSAPQPGSGYLDSFTGMSMPHVMDMQITPSSLIDLSILAADSHNDLQPVVSRPQTRRSRAAIGGEPDQTEDANNDRRTRQQRSPSDESAESSRGKASKKQRGRPRLDPKDENAADRRRTQIRLAQRAYRLRKETTIASLTTRVTKLETAVEGMQAAFLELQECATQCMQKIDNNQRKTYGDSIQAITERFLALSRGALTRDTAESQEEDTSTPEAERQSRNERPRSRDDGAPGGSSNTLSVPWGGYQVSYARDTPNNSNTYNDNSQNGSTAPDTYTQDNQDRSFTNFFEQGQFDLFPSLPQQVDPPTYSYQESSFSRRLHRACLEKAYSLLTDTTTDLEVKRAFAYTLCFASREDIAHTIGQLLRTSPGESLSPSAYENLPLYGVPTPFQEDTMDNYASIRKIEGLRAMANLGILSKFLKPSEVEQLLRERGILSGASTESAASTRSSTPESSHDPGYISSGNSSNATSVDTHNFGSAKTAQAPAQGARTGVDIDLLVKELIKRGICLGQYPGFKRSDVDDCIMLASREQMAF